MDNFVNSNKATRITEFPTHIGSSINRPIALFTETMNSVLVTYQSSTFSTVTETNS